MENSVINDDNIKIDTYKFLKAIIAQKECKKIYDYINPTYNEIQEEIFKKVFG